MKKISILYPKKLGTIAPEVYGHFSEHIGGVFYDGLWVGKDSKIPNINGFRKETIEKLRAINPPVLRWPGGCFAEVYNWRDGIGENRPVRRNWWTKHDGRYEPNEVGTHEFIELCELIGAKPYFAVNVTSITPMEAWNWMDYCLSPRGSTTLALEREKNGHPEPFNIPFWGIGNENWGGGGNMSPESYALEYRRFATLLQYTGFDIELIAGGANGADYNWTRGLAASLEKKRSIVDAMSFHYYCSNKRNGEIDPVNFTEDQWYELFERAERIEDLICRHHGTTMSYKMEDKLKLVIDEWGCWHAEGSGPSKGYNLFEQQSTMRDAIVAALTLNIFNRHCDKIRMANVAQVCNNIQSLFLTEGEHCIVTPTYHVFDFYKDHQGAESLDTVVADNEDIKSRVSVSASVKDGKMLVTLANYAIDTACEVSLDLLGASVSGKGSARILSADDVHAHNTFDNPNAVAPTECEVDLSKPITVPAGGIMAISVPVHA